MRHTPARGPMHCESLVRQLSEGATLRPAERTLRCIAYKPEEKRLRPRKGFVPEPRPWEVDTDTNRQARHELNRLLAFGDNE